MQSKIQKDAQEPMRIDRHTRTCQAQMQAKMHESPLVARDTSACRGHTQSKMCKSRSGATDTREHAERKCRPRCTRAHAFQEQHFAQRARDPLWALAWLMCKHPVPFLQYLLRFARGTLGGIGVDGQESEGEGRAQQNLQTQVAQTACACQLVRASLCMSMCRTSQLCWRLCAEAGLPGAHNVWAGFYFSIVHTLAGNGKYMRIVVMQSAW